MNKNRRSDNKKMVEDSDGVRKVSHGMRERGKRDGRRERMATRSREGEGWRVNGRKRELIDSDTGHSTKGKLLHFVYISDRKKQLFDFWN